MNQQEEAKQLRKNNLLPKLLDELKAEQFSAWELANTPELREQTWRITKAIEIVREYLDARTRELAGDSTDDR